MLWILAIILRKIMATSIPVQRNIQKSKGAQEAHEAIRPTKIHLSDISGKLDTDAQRLYSLIWKRTLASQMSMLF